MFLNNPVKSDITIDLPNLALAYLLRLGLFFCEKNELSGACSAYGGEERRIQGFGQET
jgi:hypothetical protein